MGETDINTNVINVFNREFDACLSCLEDTIAVLSADDWVAGETNRQKPVHQACHCIVPLIGYAGVAVDSSRISFRFKTPTSYPSQQEVICVIKRVRAYMKDCIAGVVDRTLVAKALRVPPLFKMLYLLRHTIVHLSYLRAEITRRGYKAPEYSKSYRPGGT